MDLAQTKRNMLEALDQRMDQYVEMADQIWEKPEINWQEFYAAQLQANFLEKEGFSVTYDVAGMNTAFLAEWGKGKPVIGLIGEYDALPGLSQTHSPRQEALVEGGPGHGCGHNLLGTGALAAAVAVQKQLQSSGMAGTVRYYGCPAEEGGGGKVFMARAGLFDDLDAALTWHPSNSNLASKGATVAVQSSRFRFRGVSSHAGMSPHLGRSALDGVELMNIGANYMREHVLDGTRIQYIITDGGQAANIVPDTAEVVYILRAEKSDYLPELAERLRKIAQGAALMTETSFEETVQSGYSSFLSNHYLADLLYDALQLIGPIDFSEKEMAFAQQINDAFPRSNEDYAQDMIDYYKPSEEWAELIYENKEKPLLDVNFPSMDAGLIEKGATDVGDLSLITPTGAVYTACFSTGSPGHSWSNVACGGMSIGHKGMMHAAKAMALCALDLYADPQHIEKARQEFEKRTAGRSYQCPIGETVKPPRLEPA